MQINLTPDWSLPVIMVIFMANYLVVRRFFLAPVNEILLSRDRDIREADELYQTAMIGFQKATTEMESKVTEAKKRGARRREEQRADAASLRTSMLDKSRSESDSILSQADTSLKSDVESARKSIVTGSEQLARIAAENLAGRAL